LFRCRAIKMALIRPPSRSVHWSPFHQDQVRTTACLPSR
jgi:hypothetical protein